jgi:hypothetical protein
VYSGIESREVKKSVLKVIRSQRLREVGLEIHAEKSQCMVLSRHQNAGQIHDVLIANKSLENVAQLK